MDVVVDGVGVAVGDARNDGSVGQHHALGLACGRVRVCVRVCAWCMCVVYVHVCVCVVYVHVCVCGVCEHGCKRVGRGMVAQLMGVVCKTQ